MPHSFNKIWIHAIWSTPLGGMLCESLCEGSFRPLSLPHLHRFNDERVKPKPNASLAATLKKRRQCKN